MKAKSFRGTTASASTLWKKNMYQLRRSWSYPAKPAAMAPAGGTARPTTLAHRPGWCPAAP